MGNTRPLVAGPASGPQPPFPLQMEGKVIKGFGRGSKEVSTRPGFTLFLFDDPFAFSYSCGLGSNGCLSRAARRVSFSCHFYTTRCKSALSLHGEGGGGRVLAYKGSKEERKHHAQLQVQTRQQKRQRQAAEAVQDGGVRQVPIE
jgi:hypothetical protein